MQLSVYSPETLSPQGSARVQHRLASHINVCISVASYIVASLYMLLIVISSSLLLLLHHLLILAIILLFKFHLPWVNTSCVKRATHWIVLELLRLIQTLHWSWSTHWGLATTWFRRLYQLNKCHLRWLAMRGAWKVLIITPSSWSIGRFNFNRICHI